jgi:hypothetical protein
LFAAAKAGEYKTDEANDLFRVLRPQLERFTMLTPEGKGKKLLDDFMNPTSNSKRTTSNPKDTTSSSKDTASNLKDKATNIVSALFTLVSNPLKEYHSSNPAPRAQRK